MKLIPLRCAPLGLALLCGCGASGHIETSGVRPIGDLATAAVATMDLTWDGGSSDKEHLLLSNRKFDDDQVAALMRIYYANTWAGNDVPISQARCPDYRALFTELEETVGGALTSGTSLVYVDMAYRVEDDDGQHLVYGAASGDYAAHGYCIDCSAPESDLQIVLVEIDEDPFPFWLAHLDCDDPDAWDGATGEDLFRRRTFFLNGEASMSLKRRAGRVKGTLGQAELFEEAWAVPFAGGDAPTPSESTETPAPAADTPTPAADTPTEATPGEPTPTATPATPAPPAGYILSGEFDAGRVRVEGSLFPEK